MKPIIDIILEGMNVTIENEVLEACVKVGINVDKERLEKALICSEQFYVEEYNEGYEQAKKELELKLFGKISDGTCEVSIWHPCKYEHMRFIYDDIWEDGAWYEFLDKYDNREVARMKLDGQDHLFPPTKIIKEEDVIAYRKFYLKDKETANE